jgi:hypothetical protein
MLSTIMIILFIVIIPVEYQDERRKESFLQVMIDVGVQVSLLVPLMTGSLATSFAY